MAEAITEMIIPGTYIEVRSEGLIGVGGIATGNVGVVGTASKGPIGSVEILSSFADAREVFGDYDAWVDGASDELTLVRALQQVFGNGGSTVYAVRCAGEGAAKAGFTLTFGANNTPVVTLTATSEGTWGNAITVEVTAASGDAFIEANTQTVGATPLVPLHAGIVPSPRNTVRITKPNGQTRKLNLRPGGQANAGIAAVSPTGELSFVNADRPDAGDEVTASYEVGADAARDLVLRLGAAKETFTIVDAADIAATLNDVSTLVDVTVPDGAAARTPPIAGPVQLAGGNDGAGATGADYTEALALLVPETVNIVCLAGQGFTAGSAALLGHLEATENAGRERIAVIGADRDRSSDVAANADAVSSGRLILTAPGIVTTDLVSGTDARLPAAYAAAAVAGLIASLAVQVSPTNKTLAVSGLTTYYDDGDLKKLLTARVMPLERKAGYRIVKGISTDTAAFKQVSVRRIVDYAKAGTRIGSLPYIGRLNNSRVRAALQATLNGFLSDMVLNEALTEFTLTVTATRDQEINGVCLVTMMLKPTFSIDYIKVIMNLS